MSLALINKNIKRISSVSTKLNTLIHVTAVMCVQHASEHGDANPAMRLVEAMPKTIRRTALIKWFGMYSPIAIDSNKGAFSCHLRKPESKAFNNFNLDGANANPWYEMRELDKEEIFLTAEDFDDKIVSLAKSMEKRLTDGKVLEGDRPAFATKLANLKALAPAA